MQKVFFGRRFWRAWAPALAPRLQRWDRAARVDETAPRILPPAPMTQTPCGAGARQSPPGRARGRVDASKKRAESRRSWRTFGIEHDLSWVPGTHQPDRTLATRTARRARGLDLGGSGRGDRRRGRRDRRLPGVAFLGREEWRLEQESAHAVAPHLGRRVQPAESAVAGKAARQDVLQEPACLPACRRTHSRGSSRMEVKRRVLLSR